MLVGKAESNTCQKKGDKSVITGQELHLTAGVEG